MLNKIWKKILLWLMKTKFYKKLLINVIPYIRFTTYYTTMKGSTFHKMYKILKPGQIILTIDKKKLTTLLIPGEFSHAAFCVSKDMEWEISEMTHTHYTKSTFADVCFQSDRVLILECKDFDEAYINKMIDKCKSLSGAEYDTDFSLGIEALYCSELIYQSDFEKRLQISLEDLAGLGKPYISPTGLLKALNCQIIYDTEWDKNNK
jgi:hypothetical protein